MIQVRPAILSDAIPASDLLRRSITELCLIDHDNDPAVLDEWLANKTPDMIAQWIAGNPLGFLVAVEADRLLGVGSVSPSGHIGLNYVSPDARFRGVSSLLIRSLENRAAAAGADACTLISTMTAHGFYAARGYRDDGPPIEGFGGRPAHPMRRDLR